MEKQPYNITNLFNGGGTASFTDYKVINQEGVEASVISTKVTPKVVEQGEQAVRDYILRTKREALVCGCFKCRVAAEKLMEWYKTPAEVR